LVARLDADPTLTFARDAPDPSFSQHQRTTMAEPMEVDETQSHPWDDLPIQHPRQCLELAGREDHFVVSGEIVCFHKTIINSTTMPSGRELILHSSVGRILRIEHVPGQPSRALVNLFVLPTDLPFFPLGEPVPPPNRTFLEYPPELVWTNHVQWLPQGHLTSEAFVFLQDNIKNGSAGYCIGMDNAFFCRVFWKQDPQGNGVVTRLFRRAQFETFPSEDCYSKRAWDRVLKLARLIYYELSRSSITQRTSRSDYVDFNSSDWEYLQYRLADVEVVSKTGVTTLPYSRLNGTIKEVIKSRLRKSMIRLDTMPLFKSLQRVLGKAIMAGLRMPTPPAPSLRARDTNAYALVRGTTHDSFNLFFDLPLLSLDGTSHRPKHRGIDFAYDPAKRKLRVLVRFHRAYPGDPDISAHLADLPIPPDDDDSLDSDESSESEEQTLIEPGLTIGDSKVVLTVVRVTSGGSHVVCRVVESASHDYVHGSEKVLTMEVAKQLYHEYHNEN
jgi:hypothetical protein